MKVICDSREQEGCTFEGCEHALTHDKFFECTAEPCNQVETAKSISTKKAKEALIKELETEIAQLKLELKEYLEEVLPDEQV